MRATKPISEADLRARLAAGESVTAISESLGYKNAACLRSCMALLGIKAGHTKHSRQRDLADFALKQLEIGYHVADTAAQRGVSRQAVAQALKKAGYPTTVAAAIRAWRAREFPGIDIDAAHQQSA